MYFSDEIKLQHSDVKQYKLYMIQRNNCCCTKFSCKWLYGNFLKSIRHLDLNASSYDSELIFTPHSSILLIELRPRWSTTVLFVIVRYCPFHASRSVRTPYCFICEDSVTWSIWCVQWQYPFHARSSTLAFCWLICEEFVNESFLSALRQCPLHASSFIYVFYVF